MKKIILFCLLLTISVSSVYGDDEEKIAEYQAIIDKYTEGKELLTERHEAAKAEIMAKLDAERARELADCEERGLVCNNSFAKRKYDPIIADLEREYFFDLAKFSKIIRENALKIEAIHSENEAEIQADLDSRTEQQLEQEAINKRIRKKAVLDLSKADAYFEEEGYVNAILFYNQACKESITNDYACNHGLARSYEKTRDFENALRHYKIAAKRTEDPKIQEDAKIQADRMSKLIKRVADIEKLSDNLVAKINRVFEGQELYKKRDYYDEIIIKLKKFQKSQSDEQVNLLLDIIVPKLRDGREQTIRDINQLY